jgi:glycosyltransferase involved in cell wall biosynthesis
MVTTRHSLDDARIVHKEAASLQDAGHEVILLFPCNADFEYRRLDGYVLAKGSGPTGNAEYSGMKVIGLPKRPGLIGKLRNVIELAKLAADQEADIYHAHEPDLSLLISLRARSILAKCGKFALVVHDMHEFPPGELYDRTKSFLKYVYLSCHILLDYVSMRRIDHAFTANSVVRGYAQVLNYRLNIDVLYNGPDVRQFEQKVPKSYSLENGRLQLCHEGSLPFDRGLREMVEAIDILKDKVKLHIVGDVFGAEREWLMPEILRRGLQDTITISGWLPYENVGAEVDKCHVGLILFRDCMQNRLAGPPNKLFNYMNAGLPVLSVAFPEMRRIIENEQCGLLVEGQDVGSIVLAIQRVLASATLVNFMGRAGQAAIKNRYGWHQMSERLISSYDLMERRLNAMRNIL